MRAALYWAPALDDPLHALGSAWLGRDAESGATLPQPPVAGVDLRALTADARRYGLHATLKPPFRLAAPFPLLRGAVAALAADLAPFALPPLAVTDLGGFLALCEQAPCPALHRLADACVERLDPFRAPPDAAELARRRPERLSEAERAHLARWGYPHVLDLWRFHVTLTRRLDPGERAVILPAAAAYLGEAAARPRQVESICLFCQRDPDSPFLIAERFPLAGGGLSG